MKKLFLITIFSLSALAVTDWQAFKDKFGKQYKSLAEEKLRKVEFEKHLAEHNQLMADYKAGKISYIPALYSFHDLSNEEFLASMTGLVRDVHGNSADPMQVTLLNKLSNKNNAPNPSATPPTDYSSVPFLNSIRNQGQCGSCWAFSVINAIEAGYRKSQGVLIDLSEQELVNCAMRYTNNTIKNGCNGGWMPTALTWLSKNGGAVYESCDPYKATFGICQMSCPGAVQVAGYALISDNENSIKNAVINYYSLSIAVDASNWSYYKGGICAAGKAVLNHAVNLVGWGFDNTLNQSYWLVRNQWGTSWGEQGYIRLPITTTNSYYTNYTYAAVLA